MIVVSNAWKAMAVDAEKDFVISEVTEDDLVSRLANALVQRHTSVAKADKHKTPDDMVDLVSVVADMEYIDISNSHLYRYAKPRIFIHIASELSTILHDTMVASAEANIAPSRKERELNLNIMSDIIVLLEKVELAMHKGDGKNQTGLNSKLDAVLGMETETAISEVK